MDFVTHLARTSRAHDAMWVIVDRLTKSAHFLAVRMTFTLEEFYRLYIREIVRLHGMPISIVSNRDPRFTTSHGDMCHAPDPGPTRLADPNRFPGRETQDWDSLPDFFFFFFFKTEPN